MRRISIYFLIICCTIIQAQDDLVLVKLKNGKNVKGIIVQGGEPGDYYVRIKKRNQKKCLSEALQPKEKMVIG